LLLCELQTESSQSSACSRHGSVHSFPGEACHTQRRGSGNAQKQERGIDRQLLSAAFPAGPLPLAVAAAEEAKDGWAVVDDEKHSVYLVEQLGTAALSTESAQALDAQCGKVPKGTK
jgi:hypothetical protein